VSLAGAGRYGQSTEPPPRWAIALVGVLLALVVISGRCGGGW
jgi:hypothetical protein